MKMRFAGAATTAFSVLLGTVATAPAPALADSSRNLSIKSVGDLVVDGVHQRVFVSDPDSGKIVATTYDGTIVATATGLPRVTGLALSADGGKLYGALESSRAIVALSAAGLTDPVRYDLGTGVYPVALENVAGKLWFTYDDFGSFPYAGADGNIGSLDLSGAEPAVTAPLDTTGAYGIWHGAPELTSAPGDSGLLAAFDPHSSGGTIGVYNVSGGTFTRTEAGQVGSGYTRSVAFTPDAAQVLVADTNGVTIAGSADLAEVGSYPIGDWGWAVAAASDGTVATAGPTLKVFAPGGTAPIREYSLPDTDPVSTGNDRVAERGLAWEPGGNRLFAVTENYSEIHHLRVYTEPKKSLPSLKLSGPASATRAKPITITGSLTASLPLPAGTPVTVTRTDLEYPSGKALGTRTTAANGSFSFTDTTSAGGTVTYRVSYAGDATHAAVSATKAVAVSRTAPSLAINNNGKVYGYGSTASFTARLGTTYKNRTVEIWADPYGGDLGRRLLKRAVVNSKGTIAVNLKLYRNTAVTATFTGDARTAAKTAGATVYVKVPVSLKLSRHYRSSGGYKLFRKKTAAQFTVRMPAHSGRKAFVQLQVHYNGRWQNLAYDYFPTSGGTALVALSGGGLVGYKLRVRAAYRKGGSGDNVNYTTYTPYSYLKFTK
ncbi:Ig-like domain-containing protein [Actinoplanes xinjiangensis]|uniref:Ig-like domain-containing protein n=1 Tax=Actinoplanes xinjiangensis TaxID=512350 RepID=UPI00343DF00D